MVPLASSSMTRLLSSSHSRSTPEGRCNGAGHFRESVTSALRLGEVGDDGALVVLSDHNDFVGKAPL